MAELDFATLAEFAKVDSGGLTIIGAAAAAVDGTLLPTQTVMFVAGRFWFNPDDHPLQLSVVARDPARSYEVSVDGVIEPNVASTLVAGRYSVAFVAVLTIPILTLGWHSIDLRGAGDLIKAMGFEVRLNEGLASSQP